MATQRPLQPIVVYLALVMLVLITRCGAAPAAVPPQSPTSAIVPRAAPTQSPTSAIVPTIIAPVAPPATLPLQIATPQPTAPTPTVEVPPAAGWKNLTITDFAAFHSPVNEDSNEHLIFGSIPIDKPARDLSPDLFPFLGRWEGYDYSPPVKKNTKIVLAFQSISSLGGKAFMWGASDLQFPFYVKEIQFRVVLGSNPSIVWDGDASGPPTVSLGSQATFTFWYDADKKALIGNAKKASEQVVLGPMELGRGQAFHVFKDYAQYFESRRIYPRDYRQDQLTHFGAGYLLYLPPGYEADAAKTWPLMLFLCGSGERGTDVYRFAKNAPFLVLSEKEELPFIIVAPMLNLTYEFRSFPEAYLDGVMDEVLADYRVDQKRVYMTGLSMGGEATYRYALHRPELFAAIAPLGGFDARYSPISRQQGFVSSNLGFDRLADVPVWAIHGADDIIVPLAADQATVDAIKSARGNVRFTVLANHDHDVWTDTYADPGFYAWLLQQSRP